MLNGYGAPSLHPHPPGETVQQGVLPTQASRAVMAALFADTECVDHMDFNLQTPVAFPRLIPSFSLSLSLSFFPPNFRSSYLSNRKNTHLITALQQMRRAAELAPEDAV